jgi:hypothetical protein
MSHVYQPVVLEVLTSQALPKSGLGSPHTS